MPIQAMQRRRYIMATKKRAPASKDFASDRGAADELHQHVPEKGPHDPEGHLTTNQGIRISDNQNQLKSGPRGAVLLEDFVLREKIFHFDHERIPERIVHARGSAAHGFFELYKPLTSLTKADLFQRAGERTPARWKRSALERLVSGL